MMGGKLKTLFQFIRFNIVGVINTLVDFAVYSLLCALGMGYLPAQTISYTCGVVNSYILNSKWTFRERKKQDFAFVRFILVNLLSLGVSLGVLYACQTYLGVSSKMIGKLIATPPAMSVNFIGNRLFVFRKQD